MRIVVAGSAGGTGTTTVAALLAALVGREHGAAPELVDHGGGTLAARFGGVAPPAGSDRDRPRPDAAPLVTRVGGIRPRPDLPVEVVDLGSLTAPERWEAFVGDGGVPVLTASLTPSGVAALADAVDTLAAHAPAALARSVLVATGAGAGDRAWIELGRGAAAPAGRFVLPRDRALARGGALRFADLQGGTRRRAELLADEVSARLSR